MDSILNIPHGLMFWTIINFGVFLFLVVKFGGKAIVKAINQREESIQNSIDAAREAEKSARELFAQSQAQFDNAQQQINEMLIKGREQSEMQLRRAAEEAEKVKKAKVEDALKEIERSKEQALKQLRTEVADMVIIATEKILSDKLDKDKDFQLVENYISQLNKN
ncbi:MAG: F0F1 ATP synthase subunit B [Candidatus Kapabacteria bacterium]|nr:F0F1 ATP synthase subunit B [Ignavibacteriota bacterium]MCW5886061.1 F0F1 ATP synthase subunit B [Candidatus Kapabacteria bacterium]